jgi:hypothetical protein
VGYRGGGGGGTSKLGGDERVGEGHSFLGERVGGTNFSAREKENMYILSILAFLNTLGTLTTR